MLLVACVSAALICGAGSPDPGRDGERESERRRMVDEQLRARDIHDARVLDAMLHVARHVFIPESARALAYNDSALPIGYGQTRHRPEQG